MNPNTSLEAIRRDYVQEVIHAQTDGRTIPPVPNMLRSQVRGDLMQVDPDWYNQVDVSEKRVN